MCVSTILPESCGSEDIVTILSNHDGPANGCQPARRVAMWRPRTPIKGQVICEPLGHLSSGSMT